MIDLFLRTFLLFLIIGVIFGIIWRFLSMEIAFAWLGISIASDLCVFMGDVRDYMKKDKS